MPWYKAGTVKTTNNSNAIIGAGTAFIANSRVGDAFRGPDGAWYEVTNIASDSALSISPNYQGPTVAAGSYALAPMQGYVKELADQARAIIQQWGATLAGLGEVSNENVVPIAKGGTGGKTQAQARSGLGLKSAALADVLGETTQSNGVVTGALFNSGSNANGLYTFMADGTLICSHRQAVSLDLPNRSGEWYYNLAAWTFPTAFVNPPKVFFNTWCQGRVITSGRANEASSTTGTSYFVIASENIPRSTFVHEWLAVGRWFA